MTVVWMDVVWLDIERKKAAAPDAPQPMSGLKPINQIGSLTVELPLQGTVAAFGGAMTDPTRRPSASRR